MAFSAKKAERKQLKLRVALIGPSGSGKTYSALRLATGMVESDGGKIAVLDTESRRSEYYADEFTYDVIPFDAPFSPERYIEAIEYAEQSGYSVLIIDSASHEWMGRGGIMDMLDKIPGTNSYTKWATLTPRHNEFVEKIVRSQIHLIVNLRGKDEYVLETNDKGKQVPKKVGVGAQMRDGIEYECTVSLLIDQARHTFDVMKDNTHLFDGRYEMLTEADGRDLAAWADQGLIDRPSDDMIIELCQIAESRGFGHEALAKSILKRYGCTPERMTLDQYLYIKDGYSSMPEKQSEASA